METNSEGTLTQEACSDTPTEPFKFQHPCSIVLSGPSGCGKSVLTKQIICEDLIEESPERIIWCYGQYQPLYDGIKKTLPHIEFVKGIPDFLEQDWYLNPGVRNCIVLDDLMGDAKKDERVSNLFIRGSHHRNLTVLYLTQNLFPQGKACRDIGLNTKYLLLFNNPTDKAQVMTLARRIYPTNTHIFASAYEQAVTKPYGHLLIDLRATTSDHERLKPNILSNYSILRHHDPKYVASKMESIERIKGPKEKRPLPEESQEKDQERNWSPNPETHLRFDTFTLNNGCATNLERDGKRCRTELMAEPAPKRRKLADLDKDLYLPWISTSVNAEWSDKIEEREALVGTNNKAIIDLLPGIRKTTRRMLGDFLITVSKVQRDVFYQTLMKSAKSQMDNNDVDEETAIRQAIRIYKDTIDDLFTPPRKANKDDVNYEEDIENHFESMVEKVSVKTEPAWDKTYQEYIERGFSDAEARTKAYEFVFEDDKKEFLKSYSDFLLTATQLQDSVLHRKILREIMNSDTGVK